VRYRASMTKTMPAHPARSAALGLQPLRVFSPRARSPCSPNTKQPKTRRQLAMQCKPDKSVCTAGCQRPLILWVSRPSPDGRFAALTLTSLVGAQTSLAAKDEKACRPSGLWLGEASHSKALLRVNITSMGTRLAPRQSASRGKIRAIEKFVQSVEVCLLYWLANP
jgi:hypothetical protein